MSINPEYLLDKCIEIEGLLALLIQRNKAEIPEHLYQLLEEKTETLYLEVGELRQNLNEESESTIINNENVAFFQPEVVENITQAPTALMESEDIQLVDTDNVPEAIFDYNGESEQTEYDNRESLDQVEFDIEEEITLNENNNCDEITEQNLQDSVIENNAVSFQIKLSLNDRYRFRRELFNFSDEEMEEALEMLSEMNSVEEVEDYFYNDLCWEPEDDIVREFMNMITTIRIK